MAATEAAPKGAARAAHATRLANLCLAILAWDQPYRRLLRPASTGLARRVCGRRPGPEAHLRLSLWPWIAYMVQITASNNPRGRLARQWQLQQQAAAGSRAVAQCEKVWPPALLTLRPRSHHTATRLSGRRWMCSYLRPMALCKAERNQPVRRYELGKRKGSTLAVSFRNTLALLLTTQQGSATRLQQDANSMQPIQVFLSAAVDGPVCSAALRVPAAAASCPARRCSLPASACER